ncbi:MAG: hypothetical protein ACRCUH_08835 [Shewanella sp.]
MSDSSNQKAFDALAREPWPFASMVVGDVLAISLSERPNARAYAYRYAQHKGWKFQLRSDSTIGVVYVKRTV